MNLIATFRRLLAERASRPAPPLDAPPYFPYFSPDVPIAGGSSSVPSWEPAPDARLEEAVRIVGDPSSVSVDRALDAVETIAGVVFGEPETRTTESGALLIIHHGRKADRVTVSEEYRAKALTFAIEHGHRPTRVLLSVDVETRAIEEERAAQPRRPDDFDLDGAVKARGCRVLTLASLPPGTLIVDDKEGDEP
jgi:hypothetical protein